MAAYVIKSWKAQTEPIDDSQSFVQIEGRAGGFLSWLLSLVNISPTISLVVSSEKITFAEGSLAGSLRYQTPLENTCATFYGYTKPWKEAVAIGVIVGMVTLFLFAIPGIIVGVLYYFLNKTLTVGYSDMGGLRNAIHFKRSLIEGQNIDEAEAEKVCNIIQNLVDAKRCANGSGIKKATP